MFYFLVLILALHILMYLSVECLLLFYILLYHNSRNILVIYLLILNAQRHFIVFLGNYWFYLLLYDYCSVLIKVVLVTCLEHHDNT